MPRSGGRCRPGRLTQKKPTNIKCPSSLMHQLQWETRVSVDVIGIHTAAGMYMHTIVQYRRSPSVFAEKTIAPGAFELFRLNLYSPPTATPGVVSNDFGGCFFVSPFRDFHTTPPRPILKRFWLLFDLLLAFHTHGKLLQRDRFYGTR